MDAQPVAARLRRPSERSTGPGVRPIAHTPTVKTSTAQKGGTPPSYLHNGAPGPAATARSAVAPHSIHLAAGSGPACGALLRPTTRVTARRADVTCRRCPGGERSTVRHIVATIGFGEAPRLGCACGEHLEAATPEALADAYGQHRIASGMKSGRRLGGLSPW